jgi:hypothetical protein
MYLKMSEKYKNPSPEYTETIVNSLKDAENHNKVVEIIESVFPSWIIGCSKKYSNDYPNFTSNWNSVCNKIGCKPLDIVIVDDLVFDKEYSLIQMFSELLTMFGHSVRRKEEFFECRFCKSVLPTQNIYNKLQECKIKVPEFWSMKCKNC